jgi:hypothetical protein
MALKWEEIQRLRYETGYNVVGVGAELYTIDGYAAVFDQAIEPYLVDFGSTSTTTVAAGAGTTTLTLASNPTVYGANGPTTNVYGLSFQVGSSLVVDVGPNQEIGSAQTGNVIIQAISGLTITLALQNAHGPTQYPVVLKGGEWIIRDILTRLDTINTQLKGFAPAVAGLAQADEAKFFSSMKGRRGQKGVTDDLMEQRDWARKDLCSALGIPNLWERRGKWGGGGGGAGLSYSPF